jgi:DNA invertase Pin-like site-specific DNA recombinase
MKAFLIARVSTDEQKDALPAQIHRLVEYASRQNYQHELIEIQESAFKGNRTEFNEVIQKIQAIKEPVAVVFDKIDRYTRDSSAEEGRILRNLYQSGQIELHFPSDNLVITKNSPATDLMRLGLGVVLAEYYSNAIRDNVKRRQEQMLREGIWIGKAPFGYKNVVLEDGKKWIWIDALKADAVRTAYQWYATGNYSLRLISQKIEAEYGFKLNVSQWDKILKNPFYKGYMQSQGKIYQHRYDLVISEELYEQADTVRKGYQIKSKRWAGLPYAYRGLIKCADCGCSVTFERKKGTYVYGHCTQYRAKHGATYVRENIITEQLQVLFQSISIPEEAYIQVSQALRVSHEEKKQLHSEPAAKFDSEIQKYTSRLEKIYDDYLDDKISKELYERKFAEFNKTKKSLQNKRENIEQVQEDYYGTVTHLLDLSKNAPQLFEKANHEQKRTLINLVLSNLQLKGEQLLWELQKPFDTMAFCNQNGNWYPRQDSNLRP